MSQPAEDAAYSRRLHRMLAAYVIGLLAFLLLMAWAEQRGLSRVGLGPIFLFFTLTVYAGIGIYARTSDPNEYYVAGRRIPAMYNGMAAAADWISAASFISLAGGLYLHGFAGTPTQPGGLAYVLGWTGGFCLVAILIAPHLRKLDIYTLPDYFAIRYGKRWPRRLAAIAAIAVSLTYVVAQIYGIGLIASRLTGVQFEIGIMLGLGGILLCSFLGGMKAITWTQVAQYVIILIAFLLPVSWLAYKQVGNPIAPLAYGVQLQKIAELELALIASPAEQQVRAVYLLRAQAYAARLRDVDAALRSEPSALRERIRQLKAQSADPALLVEATRDLANFPKDAASAREQWGRAMQENLERAKPLGGLPPHSQAFAGDPQGTPAERQEFELSRLNFLALMFCLMAGTASLPHLLTRYYTTSSVAQARSSVAWTVFFIGLIYISAPALASLVKYEVMQSLVGTSFDALPGWIAQWARVDRSLISVEDVNGDGLLQFGEIRLSADMIMLAAPELGGLPYVVSGLVAAGGLAAALSTADGLLMTISNALVHDGYCQEVERKVSLERRVMLSKFALLGVALLAAYAATFKPAEILVLVSASFSLAAAAFLPALVLGIFWPRASARGAVAGMLAGLGITAYYMLANAPAVRTGLDLGPAQLWFGILPISAGVFGMALGTVTVVLVSLIGNAVAHPDSSLPRTPSA